MFLEKVPNRQLTAWLFAAMIPPLIQIAGGASWLWLVVTGGVCTAVGWLMIKMHYEKQSRWQSVLQWITAALVLGELSALTTGSWPGSNTEPAVPLILLALAAWAARRGAETASRVGSVLFWFVLLLYLAVFGAGIREIEWLIPTAKLPDSAAIVIFLLPTAAALLPRKREGRHTGLLLPLVFTSAGAVLTAGVLSPQAAAVLENPFYEMSRSLRLLGIAERFEALVCAGMTVGWFALMSMLLTICGTMAERLKEGAGKAGVWLAAIAAAGWHLCGLHISGQRMLAICAVSWVVIPVLTQEVGKIKKSKKSEKRA